MLTAILALSLALGSADLASQSGCGSDEFREGCDTSITGSLGPDDAILEGSVDGRGDAGGGGSDDPASSVPEDKCLGRVIVKDGECAPAIPGALSLNDVAAFRPEVGANAMQPNGWAVRGLDTNFYSVGGAQVVTGTLLGGPAEVRFTPIGWRWSYGDGESRRTTTGGNTWAALGISEFDPTPTSHIYRAKGDYTITLTIEYAVEYRLGTGAWIPIAGVLSVPSNPLTVTVTSVKTVLVAEDCRANPHGPGC